VKLLGACRPRGISSKLLSDPLIRIANLKQDKPSFKIDLFLFDLDLSKNFFPQFKDLTPAA